MILPEIIIDIDHDKQPPIAVSVRIPGEDVSELMDRAATAFLAVAFASSTDRTPLDTRSAFLILSILSSANRPLSQVEIAAASDNEISKRTIAKVLPKLEAVGLVSRASPRGGYQLTAAGRERLAIAL